LINEQQVVATGIWQQQSHWPGRNSKMKVDERIFWSQSQEMNLGDEVGAQGPSSSHVVKAPPFSLGVCLQ